MNRTSLSCRATRRTRPSSLDTLSPALSPGRVSPAAFPLGDPLSSPPPPPRPGRCSAGSQVLRDRLTSHDRPITGLRPRPSPHDPPYHHHKRVTVVGSAGGISAPGSHGSRRDSLPSPGSSHRPVSTCGPRASARTGRARVLAARPTIAQIVWGSQSLVLLRRPAPKVGADAPQEGSSADR